MQVPYDAFISADSVSLYQVGSYEHAQRSRTVRLRKVCTYSLFYERVRRSARPLTAMLDVATGEVEVKADDF
jgi:hypothetical protein